MSKEQENYWSLVLEEGFVQTAIWTIEDKTAKVISMSSVVPWDSEEDLVEAVNSALSSAVQDFPSEASEPSKTVFGVPPSWVSEGQIKKEYLDKIRVICSKLSLSPSGFVVLPEAIAYSIKLDENSPLTGVIIGIGKSNLDVSLFRLGNLVGTVHVGRSVSIVDDVVEGLARFSGSEHMPSRFLIYDGKEGELEEVRQSLIKVEWTEDFKDKIRFLHTPKIEIVNPKDKVIAVSLAGASELGEIETVSLVDEKQEINPEKVVETHKELEKLEDIDLGKVGFVLEGDVKKIKTSPIVNDEVSNIETRTPEFESFPKKMSKVSSLIRFIKIPKINFKFWKNQSSPTLPVGNLSTPGRPFKRYVTIIAIASLIVIILVTGFVAWWFLPEAKVVIYVAPKSLEEANLVVFDENINSLDLDNMKAPVSTIKVEVSGEKTGSSTGSKVVGEKAKGKVSIRNGTSVAIKINSGTVLIGPNDLKFTLDEGASVSAASSPSSPGVLIADVTAEEIGAEYNLAKGEVLIVGNYPKSEVDAVVEDDFKGGSSREIVAVSSKDLNTLEEDLTEELIDQGKEKLRAKLSRNEVFIDKGIKTNVTRKTFNHKVGDEAESIKLELSLDISGLIIQREILNKITQKILEPKMPSGFNLKYEQIENKFELITEEDGVWEFQVTFIANLLPQINSDEIGKKIVGKNKDKAIEYLSTIPGFKRAEVKVSPGFLPSRFSNLPHIDKNISVEIVGDR